MDNDHRSRRHRGRPGVGDGDDGRAEPGSSSRRGLKLHDEETPADIDLVSVAPDVLADSLGEYVKAWVKRIRSGESGALPIILGLILIIIIFQVQQSKFLSAGNIVNLLVQAAFFVTLGVGETFALILSEIDLSVGFVAGIGATITLALLSPAYGWPWWAAVIVGLLACAFIGAFQGILITRLHLPSFVVTLASLLGLGGVLIFLFDSFKGTVGGVISLPTSGPLYNLVNGNMSAAASWIVLVVAVGPVRARHHHPQHPPAGPGPQRAPSEHHVAHHRGGGGGRGPPGHRVQRQPRQPGAPQRGALGPPPRAPPRGRSGPCS